MATEMVIDGDVLGTKNCVLEMTTLGKSGIKHFKFSNLYAYFEMPVHQLVRVTGKYANPYF